MTPGIESTPIADRIQYWSRAKPNDLALLFSADGENETRRLGFGELDDLAQRLSGRILRAGLSGRPVLLPAQSGPDFVIAFCGCLYSGAIAVPVPFLGRNRGQDRIRSIANDAGIVAAIGGADATAERLDLIAPNISLISMEGLKTETAALAYYDPQRPVLLQYTSGSTSAPKGVVVTHRNLETNIAMLSKAFSVHEQSRVLTWLPLFHDMGLIGNVLPALYCGVSAVVMSPLSFLQKPSRWLEAISRHRITISGGPNFAYELCARRVDPKILQLDLSSWELAVCAAEPVRLSTMQRFARAFSDVGFRPAALYPCYGLAEATVFVSGGKVGHGVSTPPADAPLAQDLVSCGRPPPEGLVAIVDPDLCQPVPDGAEGEVWVSGRHVAAGYWKNEEATAATFAARLAGRQEVFLRTGDLGIVWRGELYVTGRRKSLIIHRGVNLHPEDIESTVGGCHPSFGVMGAAFSIVANDQEEVVVAYEAFKDTMQPQDTRAMISKALDAVAEDHGVRLFDLVLLRHGVLPRTTSGKIQRDQCRALYLSGELQKRGSPSHHPSLGRYQKALVPQTPAVHTGKS